MTKKWSNQNLPGALHYLTGNIIHKIPVFTQTACCLGFFDVLAKLLREWPCKLVCYVLMRDHFHLIVNPCDGNIRGFGAALKSLSAKKIVEVTGGKRFIRKKPERDGTLHQVWQESFKDFPLWSAWMIWQKVNYIHANPVKARLVSSAKDYPWSSFRAFYFNATEPLSVDTDWWWPDDAEKLSRAQKELGWQIYQVRDKKN